MGFMDKVKEVGNQAASAVNSAVDKGQQTMNDSQAKKSADSLLRDLGALVYLRDTGRADASNESEIARITEALKAHEAAGSPINLAVGPAVAPPAPPAAGATPPPPGAATPPPPASAPVAPPPAPGAVAPPPPPGSVG